MAAWDDDPRSMDRSAALKESSEMVVKIWRSQGVGKSAFPPIPLGIRRCVERAGVSGICFFRSRA